jgi:hypothetical protein
MLAKSPQHRSLVSSIGAHAQKAKYDSRELTKNARAASPGALAYWERQVDPDGQLDPVERSRRAEHARKAHFGRLALASVKARRKAGAGDQALAEIKRWERAARLVADDPALTLKRKCFALLEMMARARRSELAAFLELAVWKGCRHLFEEEPRIPADTIGAIRALLRRGLDACPTCRRPLPDHSTLDYWRELTHDYRRPA